MCHTKKLNQTDSNISILLITKAGHLTKNMNTNLINSGINFGCCDIKKVFGLKNILFKAST